MSQEIRSLAYQLFDLLQAYIAVHNDQLGRKGIFAKLKPIDFRGNAQVLRKIERASGSTDPTTPAHCAAAPTDSVPNSRTEYSRISSCS
jgi:hypothetical protein